jgi:hypothetical protein
MKLKFMGFKSVVYLFLKLTVICISAFFCFFANKLLLKYGLV